MLPSFRHLVLAGPAIAVHLGQGDGRLIVLFVELVFLSRGLEV